METAKPKATIIVMKLFIKVLHREVFAGIGS